MQAAATATAVAERRQAAAAISVERLLIWAVQAQRADLAAADQGVAPAGPGGSTVTRIERRGLLGCAIDCDGSRALARHTCQPDAEVVYEVAAGLPDGRLLLRHAAVGTRPDWMPWATPRLVPLYPERGPRRPRVIHWDEVAHARGPRWHGKRRKEAAVCLLRVVDPESAVERAHETYLRWWGALRNLRAVLASGGRLQAHRVTEELPLERPWADVRALRAAWERGERGGYLSRPVLLDPQDVG